MLGLELVGKDNLPQVNTFFLEWLMGFPIGWSDASETEWIEYDAWETQCLHLLQQWLGEF